MTFLTIEAHGLDEEFQAEIHDQFGVTVKDRENESCFVVFEGPRENLIAMYNKHWAVGDEENFLRSDSPWLGEHYGSF